MNKILVTRIGGIGDVVMTTAVIAGLKELYPDSYIAYLVLPNAVDAVKGLSFINEVIPFRKDFRSQLTILKKIWHFDLSLHADVTYRPTILAALAGIRVRIGMAHKRAKWLTYSIPWQKYMDEKYDPALVAEWLCTATGIDVTKTAVWSNLFYAEATESEKQHVQTLLVDHGVSGNYIVASLHTAAREKDWPFEKWIAFFEMVQREAPIPIVLVGDKPVPGELPDGVVNFTCKTNLREMGNVIKRARLFIGGCSLPMHAARAFHIPSIGLYGPNPVVKGAPPELIAAHVTKAPCAPCEGYYSGGCAAPYCMQSIEPEAVFASYSQWLQSQQEAK